MPRISGKVKLFGLEVGVFRTRQYIYNWQQTIHIVLIGVCITTKCIEVSYIINDIIFYYNMMYE